MTARAAPALPDEIKNTRRLRSALGGLIAVHAHLRTPDDETIRDVIHRSHNTQWESDDDNEVGAAELSFYLLTTILADPHFPRDPAREAIDFATIGLVEHLIRRADPEPDWDKIAIFEPMVEAPLRQDLNHVENFEGRPVWTDAGLPEGLAADIETLRNTLDDPWRACLDAIYAGTAAPVDQERLVLTSLSDMLSRSEGAMTP